MAMGRFGNVMLVAGEPDLHLDATRGEVVRVYFTNTANTRVFNVTLPGAQMKLVGADAGHYEHEGSSTRSCSPRPSVSSWTCSSPMRATSSSSTELLSTPTGSLDHCRRRGGETDARGRVRAPAHQPRHGRATRAHRAFFTAPPDKTLSFVAEMDMGVPEGVPVV